MAAASYIKDNDESTPTYLASATGSERALGLRPSPSTPLADLQDQYLFQSQRIKLDLGARIWPVSTPCFGYKDTVEGVVSLTTLDHVKSVVVKVEATVEAFFTERGVPGGHTEIVLFQRSIQLYTNSPNSSGVALSYPFSIKFPTSCDEGTNPLPPSFVYSFPGVSAEVRYRVRVDMSRSGLRRRESLVVPILYLPRSCTPANNESLPPYSNRFGQSFEAQGMEELPLVPRVQNGSKRNESPSSDIQAKIALPSSLLVASGDRIPLIITIHSQSQALAALYTDISLQFVKFIIIKSPQKKSFREEVLALGEMHNEVELENGTRILRGELGGGVHGAELSWSATGVIEVKHAIRIALKPPASKASLSTNLPIFERTIPIEVMTHRHTPKVDTALPALGLIGINTQ
ncbi:unnamed protein product [Rhizoctonia solani]|uniref:Uncharacterized protein n=1 Tax=Rhizoctonia solani TaxID=456999 RepID=A0A8H2XGM7_9AGAM|nr:unnamed protein product [Rhizoctonia solani]